MRVLIEWLRLKHVELLAVAVIIQVLTHFLVYNVMPEISLIFSWIQATVFFWVSFFPMDDKPDSFNYKLEKSEKKAIIL